jgi:alpha-L-arabinofuranosidase
MAVRLVQSKLTTLGSADLNAENSFERPKQVTPEYSTLEVKAAAIPVRLKPYSVNVYCIPVQ